MDSMKAEKGGTMWDMLVPAALLVAWFVLMRWVLPGMGVST